MTEPTTGTDKPSYRMLIELNAAAATPEEFSRLAMDWLRDSSTAFMRPYAPDIDTDKPRPFRRPDDPEAPWGPGGALWAKIMVARTDTGRPKYTNRAADRRGWQWLEQQLHNPPWTVHVQLYQLDDDGYPVIGISRDVTNEPHSPGWIRLHDTCPSRLFTDPTTDRGQRHVALLRQYAERINPSYGQIGYDSGSNLKTTLEYCLPVDYGRNSPMYTVGQTRQWLRGYTWITILADELAHRLGGVQALEQSGVWHHVEPLPAGGVWLQATADLAQFDQAKAEAMFRILAPVLRAGQPRSADTGPPAAPSGPVLLALEDAANYRTTSEANP